ncbi:hypothetical protein [Devosia sp.]|uniref:hypothetical protein n=1 Tax=Devosia sp. TaxID=1871048 RepID=UPI0032668452
MNCKIGLAAVAALLATVLVSGVANAASIQDQLSPQQLVTICANHPSGSEVSAMATLQNGTTVSGSVHCDAEQLAAATQKTAINNGLNATSSTDGDDDSMAGNDESGDDYGNDSGSDDHGPRHGSDDD